MGNYLARFGGSSSIVHNSLSCEQKVLPYLFRIIGRKGYVGGQIERRPKP